MDSVEHRFHSAVEIIKSLPKSGSVHPSTETKLKFYSYFKQATEGPCEIPKPGFWEVISRAKWDAWHKLGDMSKEEAMKCYVAEFVKVMQQYSLDDFGDAEQNLFFNNTSLIGPYIDLVPQHIQEKIKHSNGNGSLNNNETTDSYNICSSAKDYDNKDLKPPSVNGHNPNNNDSDSDEFSDTLERVEEDENEPHEGLGVVSVRGGGDHRSTKSSAPSGGGAQRGLRPTRPSRGGELPVTYPREPGALAGGSGGGSGGGGQGASVVGDEEPGLAVAVIRLQHVLEQVVERLDSLETLLAERRTQPRPTFLSNPRVALLLLLAWPLLLQWIVFLMRRRRRQS